MTKRSPAMKFVVKADPDELAKLLDGVVGAVEATRYEHHALWLEYHHRDKRYSWKQGGWGLMDGAGEIGGKPICVSLLVDEVDGHRILFYHATSRCVDHDKVRAWLERVIPPSARGPDGRVNKTDAMNFCNVLPRAALAKALGDQT